MKKHKRPQNPAVEEKPKPPEKSFTWWPWAAALAALFAAFEAYGPALRGPFVLDDLYLLFTNPRAPFIPFTGWIGTNRPFLMASYFVNLHWWGTEPYSYHVLNVLLHLAGSAVIALIAARLLELAGVSKGRIVLSVFAGGLFLLHPLQTESVAYVASRSEVLSVLLYMSAFAVFLYRGGESLSLWRALVILILFGGAVTTKEHTMTLPVLLLAADYFWGLGGWRKNGILYGLLGVAAVFGGVFVWRVVSTADTAGFHVKDLTPATYFFTQCRVVWMYVGLFFLPFGQNADPDVALSNGLFDHGAILALLAWIGVVAAAWIYRKRFPLAAFGVFLFLLLLAPTSTVVPIRDVLAERRMYLPFLGLTLVCLELLRRVTVQQAVGITAAVLIFMTVLTAKRSAVWGDPLLLWQDTVAKSPNKWRPRFQLAHAYYLQGQCSQAAQTFDAATKLGPSDFPLLVDWGLSLDCEGQPSEAIEKLRQAAKLEHTAHVMSQIGMIYAKQRKLPEALEALAEAEKLDPAFAMTYAYRGGVFEVSGDRPGAAREYQKGLALDPANQMAIEGLARVSR